MGSGGEDLDEFKLRFAALQESRYSSEIATKSKQQEEVVKSGG